ncbi:MAG: AlpA family phage regulatory protein, partial [SAR324 cluster bacterium]|nr:AlpA family phage regulatory protein [SAR324 cluster bacterium]
MENIPQKRFIRLKDVENQVGFKRSKIQELASAGLFPKPIKLGTLKSPNAFDCWLQWTGVRPCTGSSCQP